MRKRANLMTARDTMTIIIHTGNLTTSLSLYLSISLSLYISVSQSPQDYRQSNKGMNMYFIFTSTYKAIHLKKFTLLICYFLKFFHLIG